MNELKKLMIEYEADQNLMMLGDGERDEFMEDFI